MIELSGGCDDRERLEPCECGERGMMSRWESNVGHEVMGACGRNARVRRPRAHNINGAKMVRWRWKKEMAREG